MKNLTSAGSARPVVCHAPFGKLLRAVSAISAFALLLLGGLRLQALQLLPGVYGYGLERTSTAAAGFKGNFEVIEVTNLDDYGAGESTIANSLREVLARTTTGARVIVFRKSGTITLKRDLSLSKADCTIAGQTAPWPGITIKGGSFVISADNVLVQHLRIRPGDDWNAIPTHNRDAIRIEGATGANSLENIVIDHCTFQWTLDESVQLWNNWDGVTFNRCAFVEPLAYSIHIDEGQFYDGTLPPKTANVPLQAESFPRSSTEPAVVQTIVTSGTTYTPSADPTKGIGSGNNYHLVSGHTGDYIEYCFNIKSAATNRTGNVPLITGITGPGRGSFRVEVYAGTASTPAYTSQDFNPAQTYDSVDFIGEHIAGTRPHFTIPGSTADYLPYRIRVVLLGQPGAAVSVGIDQIGLIQNHAMGPLLGWGSDTGGRLSFTGSVFAHLLGRGPWVYSKQFLFANNVLYNRLSRFMMLGHEAESPHAISSMKAEIVGNRFIEGKSWGGDTGLYYNTGLASTGTLAQIHVSNNDWNKGGAENPSEYGAFASPLSSDNRLVTSNPTLPEPAGLAGFVPVSPNQAFADGVLYAGARPAERDSAERGVMTNLAQAQVINVRANRPGNLVNSVADAGGWPTDGTQQNTATWTVPGNATTVLASGYTVMEEWLQQLAAQVEGSTAEAVVRTETFDETTTVAPNWSVLSGAWVVNTTPHNYKQTVNTTAAIALYDGGTWATDYSVSATLTTTWGGTGNRVGLVYNYVNSSNYNYVTFNTAGDVEVSSVTNGGSPQTVASGVYSGGAGVPFNATVRRRGNMTAILVNGVACLPNVWQPGLGAGKAGLFSRSNTSGVYDDFRVALVPRATTFHDFENSATTGWTATSGGTGGTWQVTAETGNKVYEQTQFAASAPFAILDNSFSDDHSVTADAKLVGFDPAAPGAWFGLCARYTGVDNYYYAKITGSTVEIKKMLNTVYTTLGSVVNVTTNPGDVHTVRFVVSGYPTTTLELYVDGVLKVQTTDSTPLPPGKAGLLMYRADVKYDNVSAGATRDGAVLVAETFNDGNVSRWTPLSGSWAAASALYRQSATGATDSRTRQGGFVTNQSVEADITPTNSLPTNKWAGLIARFNDATNYYYLKLGQSNVLELKKLVNNTSTVLDSEPFTVVLNTPHTLRLEVIGTCLRGYVDGQLLVRANDTTFASGTGGAALMTSGLTADFDDVLVTAP